MFRDDAGGGVRFSLANSTGSNEAEEFELLATT